jgi:hypothetical protein
MKGKKVAEGEGVSKSLAQPAKGIDW